MRDWIKAELRRQRKTQAGLAKALGRDKSVVTKMLNGKRRILAQDVPRISAYLGKPLPISGGIDTRAVQLHTVVVEGVLAMGVWREAGAQPVRGVHHVPWVPDPKFLGLRQYARLVETAAGSQVDPGDYAIFVPFDDLKRQPQDEDYVHVVRTRDDLEEHSLRRVKRRGNTIELHVDTLDGGATVEPIAWTPNNPHVQIVGLFIGSFRPPRRMP